MNNPVTNYLSLRSRQRMIVILLLLLNVVIIVAMSAVGAALKPYKIVDFELAGSVDDATMNASGMEGNGCNARAFFVLGFDYLFMLAYSVSLWFVCLHVGGRCPEGLTGFMIMLAWLQPVAAVLDAIENAALFQVCVWDQTTNSGHALSWWSCCSQVCHCIDGSGVLAWHSPASVFIEV